MPVTLAVMTAPRAVDYLTDTLLAIDGLAGGWDGRKLVMCDGVVPGAHAIPDGWEVAFTGPIGPPLGSVRAFWKVLEQLDIGDGLMLLHDDARPARGMLPYARRLGVPSDLAAVVYFQEGAGGQRGLHERTFAGDRSFVGVIGTMFSADAVAKMRLWDAALWPIKHGLDCAVSRSLRGDRFAVHVPHLVQHVGVMTAIARVPPAGIRESAHVAEPGELEGLPRIPEIERGPAARVLVARRRLR